MTQVFLISVYALATLAGLLLTVAEEFPVPTCFTVVLAPLAYLYNERRQQFRLSLKTSNILGLVAIALAGAELFIWASFEESGQAELRRVLAAAHLLSYLTWISLFQSKEPRHYWFLLALGLMQVALGSILSNTPVFGLLFFFYVFLGLWTLSVFSLYQAEQTLIRSNRDAAALTPTHAQALHPTLLSQRSLLSQLVHREPDNFRNAIQIDPNERWVNRRFVAGILGTSVFAICVGMAFFVFIPRVWVGRRPMAVDPDDIPAQRLTGMTAEVQLGEIGQILESNAKAMEVRFHDAHSGKELDVVQTAEESGYSEPMFRGSVMGTYSGGRWMILPESQDWQPLLPASDRRGLVRQQFTLADSSAAILFGMQPIQYADKANDGNDVGIDRVTAIVMHNSGRPVGNLSYELYSFRPRREPRPRVLHYGDGDASMLRESLLPRFRSLPPGLNRLGQLAKEIRDQVSSDDELVYARAVESHLRDSGLYQYSLNAEIKDPSIDPIEDFLFNRKTGHCEYYASAMALMLRSQGIPTRLVSGYKGGDKNKYSGAFVVEQRHAHAWLEALINDDAWYTFDPTPAGRDDFVRQVGFQRSFVAELRETLRGLWNQNIVNMSYEQQSAQLYEPLANQATKSGFFPSLKRLYRDLRERYQRGDLFSQQIWNLTFFSLLVIYSLRMLWLRFAPTNWGIRRLLVAAWESIRERFIERGTGRRIDFYERLTRILKQHGFSRGKTQTPLEFALDLQAQLADRVPDPELRQVPVRVVRRFYDVRFGEELVPIDEVESMNSLLAHFADALKVRPKPR